LTGTPPPPIRVELVKIEGQVVTLKADDGNLLTLFIAGMSKADRQRLESLALHEGDESKDQESDQSIPTPKVSGKIRGLDFSADRTFVYDGSLYIQQGNEDGAWDFPDLAVEINLSLNKGESPAGKTRHVTPK